MNYNNLKIKNNIVSFDTESTGLIPWGNFKRWGHFPARPFAFSFYDEDGNSAFFRLDVDPFTRRVIPNKPILKEIGAVLGNAKIRKVGYNLSFDIRLSLLMGLPFAGPVEDALFMAHIITGGAELSYQLKDLGAKYLNISKDDETALEEATKKIRRKAKKLGWKIAEGEAFGKKPHKADTWMAPPELLETYAVRDAERTIMAKMLWLDEILKDPQATRVYAREMRLFPIVRRMEDRGVRVFPEHLKELRKFYQVYMNKWRIEADKRGGKGMNFNSPPQLRQKFIKEKKYVPMKTTEKGTPKVDGAFLQTIAARGDKLAKAILEYNGGAKMINTFLEPYERYRVQEGKEWILHPNYKQCGPVTGRFSCGEPNLMQVASPDGGKKRTEVELRPREAFGPRPGYIWYLPDYCLHPDTLIKTLTGDKKIKDIVPGDRVLTYRKRRIKYGEVTKSISVRPLPSYKLTFDNGKSVIASSDHRWLTQSPIRKYLKSKVYIKITESLQVGERMIPFRQHMDETFYTLDGYTGYTKIHELVAEAYYGKRPKGFDIHHKDGNKNNNLPNNLEYKKEYIHASEHAKKNYLLQNHYYRIEKLREGIKKRRSYKGAGNIMWGKKHSIASKEKNRQKKLAWWRKHPEARKELAERNRIRNHNNHILIKKEYLGLQPMHAITVEPDHNYVLSCGVVTCNCQIEVWLFAYSAQEPAMIKALLSGHDFHGAIATQVWGDRPDFEKEWVHYRKRGKLIMFCKIYGGGSQAVADLLGCTKEEAAGFIHEYDSMFPGVRTFMKRMVNRVEREGKIYNPFGRVYYIDSRFSYKATNYFIQGSAADIIKEAMIAVNDVLNHWPGSELLMTLHDELIPEIPLKFHCKKLMRQIVTAMQGEFHKSFNMPNPLPVSMKIATKRWSDTIEVKL